MSIIRSKSIGLVLPLFLLGLIVTAEIVDYNLERFSRVLYHLKALLFLAFAASLVPILKRSRFLGTKAVTTKLSGLYLVAVSSYLVYAITILLRGFVAGETQLRLSSQPLQISPDYAFLPALFFSVCGVAIFTALIMLLKDLIYIKRKQPSARNFAILLFFLALQIGYAHLEGSGLRESYGFVERDLLHDVLLYMLIVLIVLNSLRNSWVNYLNKKQKIHCLLLGVPLVAAVLIFYIQITRDEFMLGLSPAAASFIESAGLFFCIYVSMGFLSLLLHLPTAGTFDRKIREIESLQDLSRTLPSVFDSSKIAAMITTKAAAAVRSNALWLQLADGSDNHLRVVSSENLRDDEISNLEGHTSNGLNSWIVRNKRSVLINEVSKDPRSQSIKGWSKKIDSILGVPLLAQNDVQGILYSGRAETFGYDEEEREVLEAFANQASIALENARLIEEVVSKQRFEQELKVAHDAQRKLLPKCMPHIRGLDVAAVSVTANEVGGDYYDFFESEESLAIVVADVSGKGANAAFYMAELKGIIESLAALYSSPKELMIQVNKSLYRNLERSSFISLLYSIIDVKKKELVFTRAGHCPLLVCKRRSRKAHFFEPPGMGLGLHYGNTFENALSEQTLELESGDILIFYTDGVTEARNPAKVEFEQEGLSRVVFRNRHLNAAGIKESVVNEIRTFVDGSKPHDDLTFVVAKMT